MKPTQERETMAALLFLPDLTDGRMRAILLLDRPPGPLFLQVGVAEECQMPEANQTLCRPQLALVEAENLFDVGKEGLAGPSLGSPTHDSGQVRLSLRGCPVADLFEGLVEPVSHYQYLAGTELLHPSREEMAIDPPGSSVFVGPSSFLKVGSGKAGGVRRQGEIVPSAGRVLDPELRIGLEPSGDRPTSLEHGSPQLPAGIPTIDQDMGLSTRHRREVTDGLQSESDLALERGLLLLTNGFLTKELGRQGTAPAQQEVQAGEETVPFARRPLASGVVPTEPFHLLPLALSLGGVIEDQEAGDEGLPRRRGRKACWRACSAVTRGPRA
jgi:hypothetical protein